MAAVTTSKVIDIDQLITEVGGIPLTLTGDGPLRVVAGDLPQEDLDAAVAAHVAQTDPEQEAARARQDMQAQIDQLSDMVLGF